ncbi:MAG: amidohydrolase family protein, partial [Planctomycetota bacterium]
GSVKVAQGYNPERNSDLGGTRMGMWWMLRWYLDRAKQVADADTLEQNPDVASIEGIFQHKYPFLVHTAGARDTFGTVRMFQVEAGVPVIVSHGSFNGFMAGEAIAELQTPLNIGPRNFDYSVSRNAQFRGLVEAYESAGNTDISVQTDAGVIPQEEFVYQATLAERLGCTTWTALESINVDPARQILVEDQVGRLLPGMQADIVVSSGQPLDPRSAVLLVLIEGEVTYDIHQGRLY